MKKTRLFAGAFLATFLWGSAFPCVKIGYEWFDIQRNDTGSQMYFAGMRFFIAGLLVLVAGSIATGKVLLPQRTKSGKSSWPVLFLLALTQTFLQYFFYYIGLAHVTGTKGAIMNSLGTLFTVILGMIYFHNKPGRMKIAGVIIGMAGVVYACFSGLGNGISLAGEGALLVSALFVAIGNIVNKKAASGQNPMLVTGWHLSIGGLFLLLVGVWMGGCLHVGDGKAVFLMGYMIFISAAGFGIWSYLLKHFQVEDVAVFMFLTPIFGTLMSGLVLGEGLMVSTVAALVLVCAGIVLVERDSTRG